jgi:hypothetical protein
MSVLVGQACLRPVGRCWMALVRKKFALLEEKASNSDQRPKIAQFRLVVGGWLRGWDSNPQQFG